MNIQCLAIYPLFGLMVHSHRQTDRLSYPNSRDAIASKNNLLLIRMAQLPLKIYERTQSVYTLRVSPGTCHVSNRQSDQVQQSCNEDLRR